MDQWNKARRKDEDLSCGGKIGNAVNKSGVFGCSETTPAELLNHQRRIGK